VFLIERCVQGTIENDEIVAFIKVCWYWRVCRLGSHIVTGPCCCGRSIGHFPIESNPNWSERSEKVAPVYIDPY